MSEAATTSSDRTKADEDAMTSDDAGSKEDSFDSDDDNVEMEELAVDRSGKRKRPPSPDPAPSTARFPPATTPPHPAYMAPWIPSQWMPPQWMSPPHTAPPQHWVLPATAASSPYLEGWPTQSRGREMKSTEQPSSQGSGRANRRHKKVENDHGKGERKEASKKPHTISVTSAGEIDAGCSGKNSWDSLVRTYVPRLLDMSVIDWEKQKPEAVQKLRDSLDRDFSYEGHELGALGFRNAIKRYLKMERSRLKIHFAEFGAKVVPAHVFPDQWERLIKYWGTEKQQKKAATMAQARKHVKNCSTVGRKGRAGKESALRRARSRSPGITDAADGTEALASPGVRPPALGEGDRAKILALEKSQAALQGEFSQVLAHMSATSTAVEELKSMMTSYLGKNSGVAERSPSVSKPAQTSHAAVFSEELEPTPAHPTQSENDVTPAALLPNAEHTTDAKRKEMMGHCVPSSVPGSPGVPGKQESAAVLPRSPPGVATNPKFVVEGATRGTTKTLPLQQALPIPVNSNNEDECKEANDGGEFNKAAEEEGGGQDEDEVALGSGVVSVPARPSVLVGERGVSSVAGVGGHGVGGQDVENTWDAEAAAASAATIPPRRTIPSAAPKTEVVKKAEKKVDTKKDKKVDTKKDKKVDTKKDKVDKKEKKGQAAAAKDQFRIGDQVYLKNPRSPRQKLGVGTISGMGGQDMFHHKTIPAGWYKVDVTEVKMPHACLMFENEDADQRTLKDVKGGNTIWDRKYLQLLT